jgi:predicted component of type VI protein secretion system
MAILRLVPASGTPHELRGDALVGREPGCDVVVSDGSVSRKHARLELRPTGWMVVDQGSANGTFLDSQRVAEGALRDGQELRFGAVGFKVELDDEMAATMVATPSPDATVVAPAHLMPTPPLGIPSATPLGPQLDPPPAPAPKATAAAPPKAGPPPLPAPPRVPAPATAPPLPASPSAAAARDRFATRPAAGAGGPAPVGQMAPPPLTEKKGRGPIVWIIAGCCGCLLLGLLAAAGIGGAAFFATQAPASTVQSHLAELRQGDLDAAYRRLSPELQAQLPPAEFEQLVKDHPGLGQNKDATFWNRSVNNDGARLTGVLTATSGDVEPATFELVKQGGDWRITAIRVGPDAQ